MQRLLFATLFALTAAQEVADTFTLVAYKPIPRGSPSTGGCQQQAEKFTALINHCMTWEGQSFIVNINTDECLKDNIGKDQVLFASVFESTTDCTGANTTVFIRNGVCSKANDFTTQFMMDVSNSGNLCQMALFQASVNYHTQSQIEYNTQDCKGDIITRSVTTPAQIPFVPATPALAPTTTQPCVGLCCPVTANTARKTLWTCLHNQKAVAAILEYDNVGCTGSSTSTDPTTVTIVGDCHDVSVPSTSRAVVSRFTAFHPQTLQGAICQYVEKAGGNAVVFNNQVSLMQRARFEQEVQGTISNIAQVLNGVRQESSSTLSASITIVLLALFAVLA